MPSEDAIEIGDYVVGHVSGQLGVIRKITRKRKTGFSWIYPLGSTSDYWSENSNDPFFELGWTHIPAAVAEQPYMQQVFKTTDKLFDERSRLELAHDQLQEENAELRNAMSLIAELSRCHCGEIYTDRGVHSIDCRWEIGAIADTALSPTSSPAQP